MVETFQNKGQRLLDELVQKHGTIRAVAGLTSIHENQLGNYHRNAGLRKPLIEVRKTLETDLGIPFFSWDEPADSVESKGAA
jgi:transcriptional regulator with XRE-family HTH domain